MSGHVENKVFIAAPVELTWELANSTENDKRHSPDGHAVVAEDPARGSRVLRVATPPDVDGRVWEYHVERVMDAERHLVYARRFGNPFFLYSCALWVYAPAPGGSTIRCVQDFETTSRSPVDDEKMAELLFTGTEGALRSTVELIEAEAGKLR
jgi:aromatase